MPADESSNKKAIIVVEDTQQIGELIKETLNDEPDYQAVVVRDGALALEVIRSVKASLILLDLNIPGIQGLELYDMLQADETTRDIPVIFITANYEDPEFKVRKYKNYIAKPFSLDELLDRVAAVCRTQE